jgi:hypothetical protein
MRQILQLAGRDEHPAWSLSVSACWLGSECLHRRKLGGWPPGSFAAELTACSFAAAALARRVDRALLNCRRAGL